MSVGVTVLQTQSAPGCVVSSPFQLHFSTKEFSTHLPPPIYTQMALFRPTPPLRAFIEKGRAIGSKGQKHMMYLPTKFLYRLPSKRYGPGPVLMKYWWTLGTFPTGLEIPFRLQEFHDAYIKAHVPEEVEEWLGAFVKAPVAVITSRCDEFVRRLESEPAPVRRGVPVAQLHNAKALAGLLDEAFGELGLEDHCVPVIAVRTCAANAQSKADLLNAVFGLSYLVKEYGSTTHRRWGRAHVQLSTSDAAEIEGTTMMAETVAKAELGGQPLAAAISHEPSSTGATGVGAQQAAVGPLAADSSLPSHPSAPFTPQVAALIVQAMQVRGGETAPDERCVVDALSVLARGCQVSKQPDAAVRLLRHAALFAHDDRTRSAVLSNQASALNGCGRFAEAQASARESVLLHRSPSGFANWAVATAFLDDFDAALSITETGLLEHPGHPALETCRTQLTRLVAGQLAVPANARGRRVHTPYQFAQGLLTKQGFGFDNPWDYTLVAGKPTHWRLDPTRNSPGSVFTFVGDSLKFGFKHSTAISEMA